MIDSIRIRDSFILDYSQENNYNMGNVQKDEDNGYGD